MIITAQCASTFGRFFFIFLLLKRNYVLHYNNLDEFFMIFSPFASGFGSVVRNAEFLARISRSGVDFLPFRFYRNLRFAMKISARNSFRHCSPVSSARRFALSMNARGAPNCNRAEHFNTQNDRVHRFALNLSDFEEQMRRNDFGFSFRFCFESISPEFTRRALSRSI